MASPLIGAHQHRNIALAIAAAVELRESRGFAITPDAIAAGIRHTTWPGRMEQMQTGSTRWILDVAHNPAGAWALRASLRSLLGNADGDVPGAVLVFSCLRDKPLDELAQILFPLFEKIVFAPIHSQRATAMEDLLRAAESTGTPANAAATVSDALGVARNQAAGGLVVVSGSVYLVGEARSLLLSHVRGAQP